MKVVPAGDFHRNYNNSSIGHRTQISQTCLLEKDCGLVFG